MNYIILTLLFLSSSLAIAGNVQSLRTDSDGNITASVRGGAGVHIPTEDTETVEANGSFTGGKLVCNITGNIVTITGNDVLTHASSGSIDSSVGLIPEKYRPSDDIEMLFGADVNRVYTITIKVDGQINTSYRNWAGASSSTTNTVRIPNITYVITD